MEVPLSQRCAPRFTCHAFVRHRYRARTLGPSMRVGLGPAHARSLIRDRGRGRGRGRDRGRARGRGHNGWLALRASDLALGRRQGHAALHLASCGGGGWGFRLDFDEDEGADSDAAAERKQAADCERGTRRAAQDEQVSAPVAVRAACERVLDYKGVAHPRRR